MIGQTLAALAGISHRLPKGKRPQECGRGRHECLRHSPMRQTVLDDVAQALVPNAAYFLGGRTRVDRSELAFIFRREYSVAFWRAESSSAPRARERFWHRRSDPVCAG